MAYADELMQKAKRLNTQYKTEKLAPFKEVESLYKEGGAFTAAAQNQVNLGRKRSLSSGMQALMSSGLSNTTMAAGLGKGFEEEVGVPSMLRTEADRVGRLAGAMTTTAGVNAGLPGASVSVQSGHGGQLGRSTTRSVQRPQQTSAPAAKTSESQTGNRMVGMNQMSFVPLYRG